MAHAWGLNRGPRLVTARSVAPLRGARYVGAMERVLVYHNPVCSKSRGALDILRERGVECDVVEYLQSPLDGPTLERVLAMLGGPPGALVRRDKRFSELGLRGEDYVTREQVVALLLEHPELMERPVVIRDGRAVIARPSERVAELLD
jgi:arsenate reductase